MKKPHSILVIDVIASFILFASRIYSQVVAGRWKAGKEIKLSSLNADKILLVFYSTDCPHCIGLLPELYRLYAEKKNKNFEVLAISLDENRDTWLEYIKTNGYNWINVNDTSGWSSKAAGDYYIYATPTMFLVDKNMNLISIPSTIQELQH